MDVLDATHALPCARCAAEAGSQLSKAHCFARAMRITAKAILKDLWCEAKRLHEDA